eukprot:9453761-Alexandrium_andersonii.AAC.1
MSASLVGSEMCIRDSARAPPYCATRARTGMRRCGAEEGDGWPHGGASSCLLYTSDAADDM